MATNYNYFGGIVTNGLVLDLDAAKVASYPGTGTSWYDISGNNNNGTLTNGPTFSGIGKQASIVFDGTDDYINVPTNNVFNFCNSTNDLPFTVSTWCYVNNLSNVFMLYNKGDNGNGVLESYASTVNTNGYISTSLYDTAGPNETILTTTTTISLQTWINITTIYSGTGGQLGLSIYLNSILQPTITSSNGTYTRMRVQNTDLFLGSFGSTGLMISSITASRSFSKEMSGEC